MEIIDYIIGEALILIPVLIILGQIIKGIKLIPDKYIPLILLVAGMPLTMAMTEWDVSGAIQGVLVTGAAVYGNQLWKQLGKSE